MTQWTQVRDRQGRIWTVVKARREEAHEEDLRFWHELLTPEQRVEAVAEALASCLKTRGLDGNPRLRRVHRLIKRPWGAVSGDRGARRRVSRPAAGHKGS